MTNVFVQPEYAGPAALLEAIDRDDVDVLGRSIIAAALYEEDSDFVQRACARLAHHPDEGVFGNLEPGSIEQVRAGLRDPSDYVRGQAYAAAGDLELFLGVDVGRRVS